MTRDDPRRQLLAAFARAVAVESDVLAVRPELTWEHLANRLQWTVDELTGPLATEARRRSAAGEVWLRLRTRFTESAALLRRLAPDADELSACVLTPDGALAVSTAMDGTVRVWNARNGRAVRVLRGAGRPVACAVSPDNRYAVATDGTGAVHVWRIED